MNKHEKVRLNKGEVNNARVKQIKEDLSSALISLTLANSSIRLLAGSASVAEFEGLYLDLTKQFEELEKTMNL